MQKEKIKIYGEIWDEGVNSAASFISRLNDAISRKPDVIDLHVHCKGGDVLEGIAIHNAIKSSPVPVDLYIDGVAASMMTIIMLACRKIYMADNAFIMVHAPSGFTYGTAAVMRASANCLEEMEKNFARAYAAKTGKTETEVSAWLDGVDNWLSANQAFAAKIIDGVVSTIDTTALVPEETALKTETIATMYQRYAALATIAQSNTNPQNSKQNMNKESLIKKFGLTDVTPESTDEAIEAAIQAKLDSANTAQATAEQKLKDERTAQITALLAAAKEPKKLTDKQIIDFAAIGETSGLAVLQSILDAINPAASLVDFANHGGNTPPSNGTPQNFQALLALGDAAVTAFKRDHKAEYNQLYKAEFGHDPEC